MTTPDAINRTALLAMHDGSATTIEDAIESLTNTGVVIVADETTCGLPLGQAALSTAIATATRAFGRTQVILGAPEATLQIGAHRGRGLRDFIVAEGAEIVDEPDQDRNLPVILIGHTTPAPAGSPGHSVRATWRGWTATAAADSPPVPNPADPADCCLAAIASAALAVCETFDAIRNRSGSDAGYRTVTLNLWDLDDDGPAPPPLAHAPFSWWLVGLGHLGQAYAWVICHLNYPEPQQVEVVLQDTDRITESTHSTGILTPRNSEGRRKARHLAETLENAGFETRIIERRLDDLQRANRAEAHVTLLGVDNLEARRVISTVGWRFAVDVGLGTGPTDFASLVLRRLPGATPSDKVHAWLTNPSPRPEAPDTPAFRDLAQRLDTCGLVEVAGKAVGASFVGVLAACLAVAEAVRELHNGRGHDVVTYDMLTTTCTNAPSSHAADIVSTPLGGRRSGRQ